MKKFLFIILLIAFSIIFSQGNAGAVLGVPDNVIANDLAFPIICEKGGGLNTLWAIANVFSDAANGTYRIYNPSSTQMATSAVAFTGYDVVSGDACTLIDTLSPAQKTSIEQTIGSLSRTYYVAYVIFENSSNNDDRYVAWNYLVDLTRGFASGFKPFQAENQIGTSTLSEYSSDGSDRYPLYPFYIFAASFFTRYYIYNAEEDSFNWWIILTGDNGPSDATAIYCDEEENCASSVDLADMNEIAVYDVEYNMPGGLFSGYPKTGYAQLVFVEGDGGTIDTWLGWAYQRYKSPTVVGSWDVIHPMDAPLWWATAY